MRKMILIEGLRRATPARKSRSNRPVTTVLLIASLVSNVALVNTIRILYKDNLDMRAYVDTIAGNFRYIKPHVKGENHGK